MPNRRSYYVNMDKFRKTRYKQRKKYYDKTKKYSPRKWTIEEDIEVLKHNITDTELSNKIRRSVGEIQARRQVLKKRMLYNR